MYRGAATSVLCCYNIFARSLDHISLRYQVFVARRGNQGKPSIPSALEVSTFTRIGIRYNGASNVNKVPVLCFSSTPSQEEDDFIHPHGHTGLIWHAFAHSPSSLPGPRKLPVPDPEKDGLTYLVCTRLSLTSSEPFRTGYSLVSLCLPLRSVSLRDEPPPRGCQDF